MMLQRRTNGIEGKSRVEWCVVYTLLDCSRSAYILLKEYAIFCIVLITANISLDFSHVFLPMH